MTAPKDSEITDDDEILDWYNEQDEDSTEEDYEKLDQVWDTLIDLDADDCGISVAVVYVRDSSTPADYLTDLLDTYLEGDITETTKTYTATYNGTKYDGIDGREIDEYSYGVDCTYYRILARRVDNDYLALIMMQYTPDDYDDTEDRLDRFFDMFFKGTTYGSYAHLPPYEGGKTPVSGDMPYIPGYIDSGYYHNDTNGLWFAVNESRWHVISDSQKHDIFPSDVLVNDEYLTADKIEVIGDFAMYTDDMQIVMVMFLNLAESGEAGMTSADVSKKMAEEIDADIIYDGEVTGIMDDGYSAYCVDCKVSSDEYHSFISVECPGDYMCLCTISCEKEEDLDNIFYEIFE